MYALTKIKGVGRRYSNLVCKKADVDLNKRYASRTLRPHSLDERKTNKTEGNENRVLIDIVQRW